MFKVFADAVLMDDPVLKKVKSYDLCELRVVCEADRGRKKIYPTVTVWGKQSIHCADNLRKGSKVVIVGDMAVDEYETKDGEKRTKVVVNANDVRFISGWGKQEADDDDVVDEPSDAGESKSDSGLPF